MLCGLRGSYLSEGCLVRIRYAKAFGNLGSAILAADQANAWALISGNREQRFGLRDIFGERTAQAAPPLRRKPVASR